MAVLAGSLSALLSEFGVIALLNKVFAIFMKPLYGLPGASIAGAITTYLSDNPAIISFSKDKSFTKYFEKYQIPALCNIGTSFGMGLIVTTFMISQGEEYVLPALIGNVGATQRPHGLQPSRLRRPWDFPGKSTGVGCHGLLRYSC